MNWALGWNAVDGVERVALVVMALIALAGLIAYVWPGALSGPLLAGEERSRRSTASALLMPLLLLVTGTSVALLVVDPHQRSTLLLVSRARNTTPECGQVTWPARAYRPDVCGIVGVDVGPIVDATLSGLDADRARTMNVELLLDTVRPRLAEAVGRIGEDRAAFGQASRRSPHLPRWIIDAVELEIIQTALEDERFDKLVVAPGPYEHDSMWHTVAELQSEAGTETLLVHESELPSGAFVQSVPLATYELDGAVRLHALVSGRLDAAETFQFSILDGDRLVDELIFRATPDTVERRLAKIELSCRPCAGLEHRLRVVASKDGSPTAEGQLVPASEWERIDLAVSGLKPAVDGAVRQLFVPGFSDTRIGHHVAEELSGLGLPVPTLAQAETSGVVYLIQPGEALLVANSKEALAEAVRWSREQLRGTGDNQMLELSDNRLGPNTVWSYEHVTVRGRSGSVRPGERNALSALVPSAMSTSAPHKIGMGGLGAGWAAAVLAPPPTPYETLTTAPFLRTIVWLAAHAKYGDSAAPTDAERRPTGRIRSVDGNRSKLRDDRLRTRLAVLALALFACFAVSARRVKRSLPGKDVHGTERVK